MKSILNNPFRIAGITANASAREVQTRRGKISAFAKVGKEITSEYDFPFFNPLQRTSSIIDKAFSDIEQNQNKVVHSLFWFTNLNPIDNTAIQHLISGNKEKAIEIWDKLTDEKEVTSKNFSAFNNIGTLYLLEEAKEEIKQGIAAKIKLIESENFIDFVHTVADETFSIDKNKQIELLIDELLTQFNNRFSTSETMELFSNCNGTTQKYLSKKFTEEPFHKIETQIEQCTKKRTKDKINAYKYATDLYNNTKNELTILESIVGNTNLQYKMLADNVAKEILQCSIDYFNESQEQKKSNNYLEEAMNLAKLAESIAVNDATKNKVKENISTLEEMKDREIDQAIEILKSIKEAYENTYAEIVKKAKKRLGIKDEDEYENYFDFETKKMQKRIKHKIKLNNPYERTINYTAVKEAAIQSINKEVAIDLINKFINKETIIKTAKSENEEKIKLFYDLLKFVNNTIFEINIKEKEELLYQYLNPNNIVYKSIYECKENEEKVKKLKLKEEKKDNIIGSFVIIMTLLGIILASVFFGGASWIAGGFIGFVIAGVIIKMLE